MQICNLKLGKLDRAHKKYMNNLNCILILHIKYTFFFTILMKYHVSLTNETTVDWTYPD